mmetsp:Transcript_10469/g.30794  ORF Transcript_10469/g.30794 Transcript_10469/m.30794 type:complete len:237 (-) Transcript_10469:1843-2553(-)
MNTNISARQRGPISGSESSSSDAGELELFDALDDNDVFESSSLLSVLGLFEGFGLDDFEATREVSRTMSSLSSSSSSSESESSESDKVSSSSAALLPPSSSSSSSGGSIPIPLSSFKVATLDNIMTLNSPGQNTALLLFEGVELLGEFVTCISSMARTNSSSLSSSSLSSLARRIRSLYAASMAEEEASSVASFLLFLLLLSAAAAAEAASAAALTGDSQRRASRYRTHRGSSTRE